MTANIAAIFIIETKAVDDHKDMTNDIMAERKRNKKMIYYLWLDWCS